MKHFIVNIGCEYGSGGPDIGKMVAESLGIPFYDRDLVDQVVEKLGVDRDLVEKADSGEENVKYEFDTTFGPRYANLTNRVIYTQFEVIHKLAAKSSCVIIGRCSNYILKDRDDCLNIFVYAPEEYKVKHIMEQKGVSQKEAQKLGWNGGPLKEYAPGKSIGGDVFTNRQKILPTSTSKYIECDIDANGTTRGSKRIVYSTENYKVYYTTDHYKTFNEI